MTRKHCFYTIVLLFLLIQVLSSEVRQSLVFEYTDNVYRDYSDLRDLVLSYDILGDHWINTNNPGGRRKISYYGSLYKHFLQNDNDNVDLGLRYSSRDVASDKVMTLGLALDSIIYFHQAELDSLDLHPDFEYRFDWQKTSLYFFGTAGYILYPVWDLDRLYGRLDPLVSWAPHWKLSLDLRSDIALGLYTEMTEIDPQFGDSGELIRYLRISPGVGVLFTPLPGMDLKLDYTYSRNLCNGTGLLEEETPVPAMTNETYMQDYFEYHQHELTLSLQFLLWKRLLLTLNGNYRYISHDGRLAFDEDFQVTDAAVRESILGFASEIRLKINRYLYAGLKYEYFLNNSNDHFLASRANDLGVYVRLVF